MSCPFSRDQLWAWAYGESDEPRESAAVAAHVESCAACGDSVAEMRALIEDMSSLGSILTPSVRALENPERIGRYRVIRKLGEGGMGIVFEAEQETPRRRVALKILRGGRIVDELSRRLFERETQTLARLNHPGIATIYESGQTPDGHCYFAMELIDGRPLSGFVPGESESSPLGLRAALTLMRDVCEAVAFAHQRGITHRDLKPANILIDAGGRPKILDFGLARLAGEEESVGLTRTGAVIGTPAYMSPEQARGEPGAIDIRTDVYALGVVIYELLSGALPVPVAGKPLHEVVRAICEAAATRLRSRAAHVPRDVEWIVHKALEKDPARRYGSAGDLAADLNRFLKNHPVTARPASTLYQFSRFVRRNRTSFVLTCLLFAAVATAAGVSWWQAVRIAHERDNSAREAEKFRRINDVLTGFLRAANVWEEGGRDAKVIDVLDGLARQIESEVEGEPLVAAALRHTLGQTYRAFSRYDDAARHLRYALDVRGRMLGQAAEETLATKAELGEVLYENGALDEAEPLLEEVLAARQAGASATLDDPQLAQSLNSIGLVRARRGDSFRAEAAMMQALTMRYAILKRLANDPKAARRERADAGNAVAQTLNNLAGLHRARSRGAPAPDVAREQLDRALPLYREALELRKTWLGPQHPETAKMHNNLAKCLQDRGELDAAFGHFDEALQILMKEPGEMHRFTGLTLRNLAELERLRGKRAAAAEFARRSATILEQVLGTDHVDTRRAMQLAGELSSNP